MFTHMKHIILFFLFINVSAYAQTAIPEYTASNGTAYQAGDTVTLGRGSAPNGTFLYVKAMGFGANTTNPEANNLPSDYSGGNAVIKKVNSWKRKGATKIYLVVGVGLMSNYWISIEDAIETCEISCK